MKQIKCEMCGSTELVKQEGIFVCEHCGSKYTVEEAKKLMVEVDNTKKLSNLYERARKSLEVDDLEHAAEYYKQILDENPNDWEAYFYSYLGEFPSFTNNQAGSVADKLGNTIPEAYNMAIDNCTPEEAGKRIKLISEKTSNRLSYIAETGESLLRGYEGGNVLIPSGKVQSDLYKRMRPTVLNTMLSCANAFDVIDNKLEEIIKNRGEIDKKVCNDSLLYIRKSKYSIISMKYESSLGMTDCLFKAEYIQECEKRINELDPSFKISEIKEKTNNSGGCYVATAVYGSYDCPEVWTLRRYRDDILAETWYGRTFIKIYYAISPSLVKWFGHTVWFKKMWQNKLDSMVSKLQADGVESTPYEDKIW